MKALWILGLAIVAAGCSSQQKADVQQNVRGVRQEFDQATHKAQKAAANQALEGKVKSYLSARKGLEAKSIDVEAKDGSVVLKGDVASPEQARLAEQATAEVAGVNSVDNQLTMRVPAADYPPPSAPSTGN
jgi:osmotically-inducible protein OsmY